MQLPQLWPLTALVVNAFPNGTVLADDAVHVPQGHIAVGMGCGKMQMPVRGTADADYAAWLIEVFLWR